MDRQIAELCTCRGKREGKDLEALILSITAQLDETKKELEETKSLITEVLTKLDEEEEVLRAEAKAEAATQAGAPRMLHVYTSSLQNVPHAPPCTFNVSPDMCTLPLPALCLEPNIIAWPPHLSHPYDQSCYAPSM